MSLHTDELQEHLRSLVRRLEEDESVSVPDERRKEKRRSVRTECEIHLFYGPGMEHCTTEGIVRNVTFDGISVVSGLSDPIRAGRPVEVHVPLLGGPRQHLAGTVIFHRIVDDKCQEIGIYVRATNSDPILTRDPENARRVYMWFNDALEVQPYT